DDRAAGRGARARGRRARRVPGARRSGAPGGDARCSRVRAPAPVDGNERRLRDGDRGRIGPRPHRVASLREPPRGARAMSEERLLLVVVGEDRAGAELPRQGVLTIGSSKERAGFCVEGPGIEGLHCAIGRTKGGGFALKDLGSSSGTRLNGKRVETARVKAGDRIHVGGKELRVLAPAGAGAVDQAHETGTVDVSVPVTPVPGA